MAETLSLLVMETGTVACSATEVHAQVTRGMPRLWAAKMYAGGAAKTHNPKRDEEVDIDEFALLQAQRPAGGPLQQRAGRREQSGALVIQLYRTLPRRAHRSLVLNAGLRRRACATRDAYNLGMDRSEHEVCFADFDRELRDRQQPTRFAAAARADWSMCCAIHRPLLCRKSDCGPCHCTWPAL